MEQPQRAKEPSLQESRIEIRFVPLPPERRAGYEAALRWLIKLMMEEQRSAVSDQLLEEPSQVNNGTESMKNIQADSNTSRFDFDEVTL